MPKQNSQQNVQHKKTTNNTAKRNTTGKTYSVKSKNTKSGADKRNNAQKKAEEIRAKKRNSISAQIMPFILGVVALLLGVFIYLQSMSGAAGGAIGALFKGFFSGGALAIPPILAVLAFRFKIDSEERLFGVRIACGVGFLFLLSMLLHILTGGSLVYSLPVLWKEGLTLKGGGVVGGFIGTLLWKCFRIAAPIMIVGGLIIVTPMLFGLTPRGVYILLSNKLRETKQRHDEAQEEREILRQDRMERDRLDRECGVVGYGKYTPSKNTSDQLTIEDELRNPHKGRNRKIEDYDVDIPPSNDEDDPIIIDDEIFNSVKQDEKNALDDKLRKEQLNPGDLSAFDVYDNDIQDNAVTNEESQMPITPVTESDADPDTVDLKKIFMDPEDAELLDKLCAAYLNENDTADTELHVKRETVSDAGENPSQTQQKPEVPAYIFPPLDLLSPDNSKKDGSVKEGVRENALKLVDTLRSFNVKTQLADVCIGPTVTRYELMPESGTKVRTIANLTDDIALAFAVKGVRIEAPVPGKSVVGIEVPNKTPATVHLRTLLEDTRFTDAKSKLHAALGEDVAGESVYLDIAKMPHLLVAGATGMGKSVCINCLIVSLLYRASPDEVKLILIDPKKVEFNLYEGLPHLLVPVVSDPKKAAGSLSWAVSEMERRFNILEDARVRDISKYNSVARITEGMEILPQIVIIIDELADLMMTASDDVEKSIARLAQKARAAGMHLIIGTQRPSVDVITGLIKNNIPSRISCAVTSQVDSRTILDRAGAEKLIGRGDMLYKPVGVDPLRVQGAFVSESEVEAIVEFIKTKNNGNAEGYSEDVIEQIEREAEKCGVSGKKKALPADGEDDGESDPMLRAALELAVESRKISTSLIQRKLSLGYGRAAKLIDRMEELGYVSAPDGQKPREVLISKEEFLEMSMKDSD